MNETNLYLLRHGESMANVNRVFAAFKGDFPLSETGIRQAELQAERLKNVRFSAVYSSPLLRARQTAEIVNRHHGLRIEYPDALRELDVGILDGESQENADHWVIHTGVVDKWESGDPAASFPDGESLNDLGKRLGPLLEKIVEAHVGNVLLVGHCMIFLALIWLFCDNHGPKIEDGHLGRGRFSILTRATSGFHLLEHDIPAE